jgi:hypothetical protein
MKNKDPVITGTVIDFPTDEASKRFADIEAELCELLSINTLMHEVVEGDRLVPARAHLARSMKTHLDRLDALLFPHA